MSDKLRNAWASYSQSFTEEILPNLSASGALVGVWNDDDSKPDRLQFATEIGLMLLWGRPVILAIEAGAKPPPAGLTRAADEIVYDFDHHDPASMERLNAAMHRITERLDEEKSQGRKKRRPS